MKSYKNLSSILVIGLVFSIMSMSIITKDKKVSEEENRELQVLPTMSRIINEGYNSNAYIYESLTGDLFKKWDNYFSDHIYLREDMVNTYNYIQKASNKKYINNVYVGEENYLFTDNNIKITENELKLRAEYFNSISDRFNESKMYIVNIPHKTEVYEEKMPIEDYEATSNKYFSVLENYIDKEKIEVIDMYDVFDESEDLYHKTDHHWNMNGTFKTYQSLMDNISNTFKEVGKVKEKEDYNIQLYENCFIGTDGKKATEFVQEADNIEIYKEKNEEKNKFKININGKDGEFIYENLITSSGLDNDYGTYLNGDNGEVIVENTEINNDLEIVIIGDSMDNPLIPLLSSHFSKVYSYDLRRYDKNIKSNIENINPKIILFIGLTNSIIDNHTSVFDINVE